MINRSDDLRNLAKYSAALTAFKDTARFLRDNRLELTGIIANKQQREGESSVLKADLEAERRLVPRLCELWPGVSVLCEEAEHSQLADLVPGIDILPWGDKIVDLDTERIDVDGTDGTGGPYPNGELGLVGMTAALHQRGIPTAAIVQHLLEDDAYVADLRPGLEIRLNKNGFGPEEWQEPWRPLKQCLVGLDNCRAVEPRFRELVIDKLAGESVFAYNLNVPSCVGGLKVIGRICAAYTTNNVRSWDISGVVCLLRAAGMVARCLDGSKIPWNQVRMPPIVFARDEATFEYVSNLTRDYWHGTEEQIHGWGVV